jgi:GNAT superfamily N-acetyltransferase
MLIKKANNSLEITNLINLYKADAIIKGEYYIAFDDSVAKGCVSINRMSWFMTEIRHLFVRREFRRQGIGIALVAKALEKIKTDFVCCTVEINNSVSEKIFHQRFGFTKKEQFLNQRTGNTLTLLIKKLQ